MTYSRHGSLNVVISLLGMPTDALNTPSTAADKSLKVYDSFGEWRTRRHHQQSHHCHPKKVNDYHDSLPLIKNGEASGLGGRSLKGSQQNSISAQQFRLSTTNQMPDDAALRYHSPKGVVLAASSSELPADDGSIVVIKSVASAPSLTRLKNHGHDLSPNCNSLRLPRLSNPASSSGHQVLRCDAPLRVARSNNILIIRSAAADHDDDCQQTQSLSDEDDTAAKAGKVLSAFAESESRITTRRMQQRDHDNQSENVTLSSQDKHRRNTSVNGMMIYHGRRKGLHWDTMSRFRSKNDISVFRRSASTVFCDSGYWPSSRQSLRLVPCTDEEATHRPSASLKQTKPDQQS